MMRKDLYMIVLVSQVFKEKMEDQPSGVDPFDLFDTFFGRADELFGDGNKGGINFNFRNNRNLGCDIRFDLHLSFEESIFGGQREIEVSCFQTCDKCDGTGTKSSDCIKQCRNCGGRGRNEKSENSFWNDVSGYLN